MFTALGIYPESFEKPFLECTSEFYASEGVKYMQNSDVPDYLKHVEVCIIIYIFFFPKKLLHVTFSATFESFDGVFDCR